MRNSLKRDEQKDWIRVVDSNASLGIETDTDPKWPSQWSLDPLTASVALTATCAVLTDRKPAVALPIIKEPATGFGPQFCPHTVQPFLEGVSRTWLATTGEVHTIPGHVCLV